MHDELVQERAGLAVRVAFGFGFFDLSMEVTSSLLINVIGVVVVVEVGCRGQYGRR